MSLLAQKILRYRIEKYYQSTSKVHAQVPQILIMPGAAEPDRNLDCAAALCQQERHWPLTTQPALSAAASLPISQNLMIMKMIPLSEYQHARPHT